MQIRLTVLRPRSGPAAAGTATDVLVTAPVGTALGAVAGALAGAVGVRGPRSATHVHLYAGGRRIDDQTPLGHPPLLDGAVLSLNEPDPDAAPDDAPAPAELRVTGGPDAGGVHRLHGDRITIGRSSAADVPLDDPDVSRLHLSLQLSPDGTVTVRDLASTNGTELDGRFLRDEAVELAEDGLVRIGESTLLITRQEARDAGRTTPDGLGRLQLAAARPPRPAPAAAPPEPPAAEPPATGRTRSLFSRRRQAEPGGPDAARQHASVRSRQAAAQRERWPDPAALLLTALGSGPRLWERGPHHPDALTLRLGTADRPQPSAVGTPFSAPGTLLPAVPVTVDLQTAGSLGLAGPRPRLAGLARAVLAQLAVLHPPSSLSLVVAAADEERAADWSWAFWLPHLEPTRGQDCRLLVGFGPEQTEARLTELTAGAGSRAAAGADGPSTTTVLLLDGAPVGEAARTALAVLLEQGPALGVFPVCLADTPAGLPAGLGATAVVTGEVDTLLTVDRPLGGGRRELVTDLALDAVSPAWAERLARVLAPLREASPVARGPLPEQLRLLDLLQPDTVTPSKLAARWAALPGGPGNATALLGTGRDETLLVDLADRDEPNGPHLLIGGARGTGKTELLRTLVASLAVSEQPGRLRITVIDGRGGGTPEAPAGLAGCTDLPQVTEHVDAGADPRRALLAAEALLDELAHREALFDGLTFTGWHDARAVVRTAPALVTAGGGAATAPAPRVGQQRKPADVLIAPARLVVVVDDLDALLSPTSPAGRPLSRALSAVAERGGRLGVHLVAATGAPELAAGTALDENAQLRIALRTADPADSELLIHLGDAAALPEHTPGRAYLRRPDGGVTAFQAARVSGRIPRTATLRPTVVAVDPAQLGAPPTRRPVRELGNGPTDLALLASALQRAATLQAGGGS
ncbi:FtsK/SpoIIIE domain-containing protein [Kitasatospora sp. NPDC096147]|uniref:FtsK/SpoIIIE domain-containing protein n=1 Tax=Kitasatospora sp. NPDC096147 TaxID=3364093 RepID=UPI003814CC69